MGAKGLATCAGRRLIPELPKKMPMLGAVHAASTRQRLSFVPPGRILPHSTLVTSCTRLLCVQHEVRFQSSENNRKVEFRGAASQKDNIWNDQ